MVGFLLPARWVWVLFQLTPQSQVLAIVTLSNLKLT